MSFKSIALAAVASVGLFAAIPAQAGNVQSSSIKIIHSGSDVQLSINGSGLVHKAGYRSHRGFKHHKRFSGHRKFRGHKKFSKHRGFSRHHKVSRHRSFGHARFHHGHRGKKFSKFHHRKFRRY